MSLNPADWSLVPEENAHLELREKATSQGSQTLTREESNALYAEWATIHAAAEAAKLDPSNFPLNRFQFAAALDLMGKSIADLKAAMQAAITDPVQRAFAIAAIENPPNDLYHRNNALFSNPAILSALGLDAATIDATWMQVKDVKSV